MIIGSGTGATSIAAVAQPANEPPRIRLTITTDNTTMTVYRVDAAGVKTPVRLANPATPVDGEWIGYDYEVEYNTSVTYYAIGDASAATSDPVTLPSTLGWLLHPGAPSLSIPLDLYGTPGALFTVVSVGTKTRGVNSGAHDILGASEPIVISDGARRSPTFDLTVRSSSAVAERAMTAVLADVNTLLLQIVGPVRSEYEWVAVGEVTESLWIDGYYSGEYEQWVLPCTTTTYPAGLQQAQWSWADVVAEYPTWQAVIDAFPTWEALLLNTPAV